MVGAFGEVQVMDWGLAKALTGERPAETPPPAEAPSAIRTARTGAAEEWSARGDFIGTLAYMSPEQALGYIDRHDARSDVFGLGAILCEILTGRPPYEGKTFLELHRQAMLGELGGARERLGACGADPELVRLAAACLAPEPADRPADAGAVAATVAAHREGVERRLRQTEVAIAEQKVKAAEARKRRRLARDRAALRAAAERAADVASAKAEQAAEQARAVEPETPEAAGRALALWRQARASLGEAERVLAVALGGEEARERLAARRTEVEAGLRRSEREAGLLDGLDRARYLLSESRGGCFACASAAEAYAAAVGAYGLDVAGDPPQSASAIRNERPAVRRALVKALDDWANGVGGPEGERLLRIADLADGDLWRRRYRAAVITSDLDELKRLAGEARGPDLTAESADLLGRALLGHGAPAEAAALLRQARRRHPADFWVHFGLGCCLHDPGRPEPATLDEAIGAYWAAVALRPASAPAHTALGSALGEKGDLDGAVACCQKALDLDPGYWQAYGLLSVASLDRKDVDGAVFCCQKALDLNPGLAPAHSLLADIFLRMGRIEEANASNRRCLKLLRSGHPFYKSTLLQGLRCERLLAHGAKLGSLVWGKRQPPENAKRLGLADACKSEGLYAAAARLYRDAFAADPALADDLEADARYPAACCAARAGGQGEDARYLDDTGRARWRDQARNWLWADLALRTKCLEEGRPEDCAALQAALRHWQEDAALSGVRDAAELAKLRADEQEACRKLWADVQGLLDKADAKKRPGFI
jgi:serine/threonine-protein kinase